MTYPVVLIYLAHGCGSGNVTLHQAPALLSLRSVISAPPYFSRPGGPLSPSPLIPGACSLPPPATGVELPLLPFPRLSLPHLSRLANRKGCLRPVSILLSTTISPFHLSMLSSPSTSDSGTAQYP